jgi:hypothetical protein
MAFSSDASPSPERPPGGLPKTAPVPRPAEALPEATLEQVIRQTADQLGQAGPADPELWQALCSAARELPAGPLTLEPVAVTLVQAVLARELQVLARRQALLMYTARAVAEAILTDPQARQRLATLWERLQEGSP